MASVSEIMAAALPEMRRELAAYDEACRNRCWHDLNRAMRVARKCGTTATSDPDMTAAVKEIARAARAWASWQKALDALPTDDVSTCHCALKRAGLSTPEFETAYLAYFQNWVDGGDKPDDELRAEMEKVRRNA